MTTRSGGYGHLGHSHLDDVLMGNLYDHGVVMRLAKYGIPYRFWALIAFVGMVGHILTMVAQPIIIAWGINNFVLGVNGEAKKLFIEEAKSGLYFEPENIQSLKEQILKLYNDRELCTQMGINGREYIKQHFERTKITKSFSELLKSVLNAT